MPNGPNDALGQLRALDRDAYVATLYVPAACREAVAALRAFDAEIAAIPDRVNEPAAGEIRLEWWREALSGKRGGELAGHPLGDALAAAIARHHWPLAAFERYLDARAADFYADPFPDRTSFEAHAGDTAGAMLQLAVLAADPSGAGPSADAAGHAGCAIAAARLLRRAARDRARGICRLPEDLLAAVGASAGDILDGTDPGARRRAADAVIALGRDHLKSFSAAASGLSREAKAALLPAATVPAWLAASAGQADLFAAPPRISPFRSQAAIMRRALFG